MYIYLAEKDDFSKLPDNLKRNLGHTEFAMKLELAENSKLAREDPKQVIANLKERGFHLQMPDETAVDQILQRIANETRQPH